MIAVLRRLVAPIGRAINAIPALLFPISTAQTAAFLAEIDERRAADARINAHAETLLADLGIDGNPNTPHLHLVATEA